MSLYSSEMINIYMNKKKKGLKISLFPLIIIIPLFVFFLIVAKLKTRALFITLSTIDLSIFTIIFMYNLLENIIKSNDLIKHINTILNGNIKEIDGKITSISKIITLKRNIHIVEVEIRGEGVRTKAYFNVDLFEYDFKVDDNIKTKLSNNFIVEYEVYHD